MIVIPTTSSAAADADANTVTNASQLLVAMLEQNRYRFVSSTNCWIKFGTVAAPPTAAPGVDGNIYVPANTELEILCRAGQTRIAVIRDAVDGNCSLTLLT